MSALQKRLNSRLRSQCRPKVNILASLILPEIFLDQLQQLADIKPPPGCSSRMASLDGWCFHVSQTRVHWQAARLACQALGGKLGSVTSSEENHIVTELGREVKSALWTGWCNSRSGWSWEDGNRWSFTAWPSCEKNTRYFFDPHIGEHEHKVHLGGAQGEGLPRRLPVWLAGTEHGLCLHNPWMLFG